LRIFLYDVATAGFHFALKQNKTKNSRNEKSESMCFCEATFHSDLHVFCESRCLSAPRFVSCLTRLNGQAAMALLIYLTNPPNLPEYSTSKQLI